MLKWLMRKQSVNELVNLGKGGMYGGFLKIFTAGDVLKFTTIKSKLNKCHLEHDIDFSLDT